MKTTPRLTHVLLLCFLAPALYFAVRLAFGAGLYTMLGFHGYRLTATNMRGCPPESWMFPIGVLVWQAAYLLVVGAGFRLSRQGVREGANRKMLLGALLFVPAVHLVVENLAYFLLRNPLYFQTQQAALSARPLAVFGTFYAFKWASFAIGIVLTALFGYWGYRIVWHHWTPALRGAFALGSAASGLGFLAWLYGFRLLTA